MKSEAIVTGITGLGAGAVIGYVARGLTAGVTTPIYMNYAKRFTGEGFELSLGLWQWLPLELRFISGWTTPKGERQEFYGLFFEGDVEAFFSIIDFPDDPSNLGFEVGRCTSCPLRFYLDGVEKATWDWTVSVWMGITELGYVTFKVPR